VGAFHQGTMLEEVPFLDLQEELKVEAFHQEG